MRRWYLFRYGRSYFSCTQGCAVNWSLFLFCLSVLVVAHKTTATEWSKTHTHTHEPKGCCGPCQSIALPTLRLTFFCSIRTVTGSAPCISPLEEVGGLALWPRARVRGHWSGRCSRHCSRSSYRPAGYPPVARKQPNDNSNKCVTLSILRIDAWFNLHTPFEMLTSCLSSLRARMRKKHIQEHQVIMCQIKWH